MMASDEQEDGTIYKVVINHEEQYSIWPVDRQNPPGWRDAGISGIQRECLDYIESTWADMRPLSLRRRMDEAANHDPSV
jgi:MbtH protein